MTGTLALRRAGMVALIAWGAVLGGCSSVSGFKQIEAVGVDRAFEATQAAMKDLQFTVTETSKDSLQARVSAKEADKTDVTVNMEAKAEHLTEFRIRVGVLNDEDHARLIMDKIKKHF
jgi:hypothetical protein